MKLYTPFSTHLSGSAKETELRLRNIFQWKKQRPPMLLLALVLVIALGCGGLVACRHEPASNEDESSAFSFENAEKMTVVNRELNENAEIGDQRLEGSFTDSIEKQTFRRGEKASAKDSYYDVTWYRSDGTEVSHMGIDLDGTLYADGYTWTPEEYLDTHELNSRFGAFLDGYVTACDVTLVTLDETEWITQEDTERAAQLGLNPDSFPDGYYIYDGEPGVTADYPLADDCIFKLVDEEQAVYQTSDLTGFKEHIQRQGEPEGHSYQLWIVNGKVRGVSESYQP